MGKIYNDILETIQEKRRLLAVLIDPDKFDLVNLPAFVKKLNASVASHVFVGGSEVGPSATHALVDGIKRLTTLPVLLFPGDITQITESADALLFLSLISGRNPDYLIGKHVEAAPMLKDSGLEVIPTGYLLIENGKQTSVQKVTHTEPMSRTDIQKVIDTAMAGQFLGQRLMYLEAGSGASHPVESDMIRAVKSAMGIPLIVGGGIKTIDQIEAAYDSGADMVVIGTAFENDVSFFDSLT